MLSGEELTTPVRAKATDLYVTVTLHYSATSQWVIFLRKNFPVAIIINAY